MMCNAFSRLYNFICRRKTSATGSITVTDVGSGENIEIKEDGSGPSLSASSSSSSSSRPRPRSLERVDRRRIFAHDPLKCAPRHVRFAFGSDSKAEKIQPIHETLTLWAFKQALSESEEWQSMTYQSADVNVWEIFRGLMWNDDPSCDLFEDDAEHNRKWSNGIEFGARYGLAKAETELATKLGWPRYDLRNGSLTGRSHFYDLQFLHARSLKADEDTRVTAAKISLWCQIMYRLAVDDGVKGDTRICDLTVASGGYRLRHFFDDETSLKPQATLFDLLTAGTAYRDVNISSRALGSLLHVIQDCYATGHTQRESMAAEVNVKVVGSSSIRAFHCYFDGNEQEHGHFDEMDVAQLSPQRVPDSDAIPGARAAIDACAQIVRFWREGKPWEGEVERLIHNQVLCLSSSLQDDTSSV